MTEIPDWPARGLQLHQNTNVDQLRFEAPVRLGGLRAGRLFIGAWSYIQGAATFYGPMEIGRYCSIAETLLTQLPEHPTHWLSTSTMQYQRSQFDFWMRKDLRLLEKKVLPERRWPISIGNDVWIGRNVTMTRGITIGDGAIIATGSIVTKDVAPYAIVAGSPARVVRMRFGEDMIERLLRIRWWQYCRNDMPDIDFDDPGRALDQIEALVAGGTLRPRPVEYTAYTPARR